MTSYHYFIVLSECEANFEEKKRLCLSVGALHFKRRMIPM